LAGAFTAAENGANDRTLARTCGGADEGSFDRSWRALIDDAARKRKQQNRHHQLLGKDRIAK
jgi:hypothetical protein